MFEEQASEQAREHPNRQEEAWSTTGDPSAAVRGQPAAWDDAMQMRMIKQLLPPGVQHGEEANLGTQVLWIGGQGPRRLGGRAGQAAAQDHLAPLGDRRG